MNSKRKSSVLFVIVSMILLSACASDHSNHNQQHGSVPPQKLTIEFSTNPTDIQTGKEIQLIARVSKGNESVKDAIVEMELWRDGDKKHEKLKAAPDRKGAYLSKKTFTEAGLYHVTLHTTTSEIHQMPTVDFRVN